MLGNALPEFGRVILSFRRVNCKGQGDEAEGTRFPTPIRLYYYLYYKAGTLFPTVEGLYYYRTTR